MKRTTAEAFAPGNLYTEGNPSLGIPATVLGGDEMNNIQEELVNPVLDQGFALDAANFKQVTRAIGTKQFSFNLLNNQAVAVAVDATELIFNKVTYKMVHIMYDIHRRTDTPADVKNEVGHVYISHNTETDIWMITNVSYMDDAGIVFSVTSSGQIRYTSSNLTGSNYTGKIRVTGVKTILQVVPA